MFYSNYFTGTPLCYAYIHIISVLAYVKRVTILFIMYNKIKSMEIAVSLLKFCKQFNFCRSADQIISKNVQTAESSLISNRYSEHIEHIPNAQYTLLQTRQY